MKPRVMTTCVANTYTGPNERIIEFSDHELDPGDGTGPPGGLISFRRIDGRLSVHVYRIDDTVDVTIANDPRDQTAWRFTVGDLEQIAGRHVWPEEVERIATAIDNSTAHESIEAAVEQVCGITEST